MNRTLIYRFMLASSIFVSAHATPPSTLSTLPTDINTLQVIAGRFDTLPNEQQQRYATNLLALLSDFSNNQESVPAQRLKDLLDTPPMPNDNLLSNLQEQLDAAATRLHATLAQDAEYKDVARKLFGEITHNRPLKQSRDYCMNHAEKDKQD